MDVSLHTGRANYQSKLTGLAGFGRECALVRENERNDQAVLRSTTIAMPCPMPIHMVASA